MMEFLYSVTVVLSTWSLEQQRVHHLETSEIQITGPPSRPTDSKTLRV